VRFEGRNVVVTGGTRGIGRAIVERFASEGADVMVIARSQDGLDATVAAVESTWPHRCDVAAAAEVDGAVSAALSRWDRVDAVINNAGIAEEVPFLEIEEESWDRVTGTNLKGAFLVAQRFARAMADRGGGSLVHIASIDASGGDGPYASYNASKAALLGLNRTMALELAHHGIRSNCVSPGFTNTEMTTEAVSAELGDYLMNRFERVPMRRLVEPSEIAAACAFLASDDASGITGIDLTVDCGLTANWFILESLPAS
jgi:NAD(P)-dependent dehydrogenase (short-subunit alcohol dehydrogenase family)